MNFDKANTEVTRKSFGSKVDKTFQREGVVPLKNRKKNDGADLAQESAKYNELNKNVENRRLNDIKDKRAFDTAISKGYENVKESLIRDFMYEICIESLLIDEKDVDANLKAITEMVDVQIDKLGGYNGIKQIANQSNNQLLKNIVGICEASCRKVGERNIREANGCASKLDFDLNKEERCDFDYKKKSIGSETIINVVRDKVLNVVKDEQKMNAEKQEVMDEIEMKVNEIKAPVAEAMDFIFSTKIEETTLFDSIMRKNYKNLIANESSAIFESCSINECGEVENINYEDDEFAMDEVELGDIQAPDMNECAYESTLYNIREMLTNGTDEETFETELNSLLETVKVNSYSKSKSGAMKQKQDLRILQCSLESLLSVEEAFDEDYTVAGDIDDDVVEESNKKMSAAEMYKLFETKMEKNQNVDKNMKDMKNTEPVSDPVDNKKSSANQEEMIVCPICKKENCECDLDQAMEGKEIGALQMKAIQKVERMHLKSIAKRDFGKVRQRLTKRVEKAHSLGQIDMLLKDLNIANGTGANELSRAKAMFPEHAGKIDEHIKWLPTYKKMLQNKRKELKKQGVMESFVNQLDEYCDNLDVMIELHDLALNATIESLTHDIEDNTYFVPYLQPNDCNLSNLEFAYKAKFVCESLRNSLSRLNYQNDYDILERVVNHNLNSINEALNEINGKQSFKYKEQMLESCKNYLTKVSNVMMKNEPENNVLKQSAFSFNNVEEVDNIINYVKEYTSIEETNNSTMELVMAETIVEYTILEAFNTLNLVKFNKEEVRKMSRNNLK